MNIFSNKKKVWFIVFTLLFLSKSIYLSKSYDKELKVHYNLSGSLKNLNNKELVIVFSDDMVALGGDRDGRKFLNILPEIKGKFSWKGTKTLTFKPETRFKYSTKYTVIIKKKTKSLFKKKNNKEIRWSFTTPLVNLIESSFTSDTGYHFWGQKRSIYVNDNVWTKGKCTIIFNQSLLLEDLKKHVKIIRYLEVTNTRVDSDLEKSIIEDEKDLLENIIFKISKKDDKSFIIEPIDNLENNKLYKIIITKGLKGEEGNLHNKKNFFVRFSTLEEFKLLSVTKAIDFFSSLVIKFTNRLNKDPIESNLKIYKIDKVNKKVIPLSKENYVIDSYNSYIKVKFESNADLSTLDKILIKIKRGLKNIYGQTLKKSYETITIIYGRPDDYISSSLDIS